VDIIFESILVITKQGACLRDLRRLLRAVDTLRPMKSGWFESYSRQGMATRDLKGMLRHLPFAFSLTFAFACGFFLVILLMSEGPAGPSVTLTLDRSGLEKYAGHSVHAKSPPNSPAPTRQAALPEQLARPPEVQISPFTQEIRRARPPYVFRPFPSKRSLTRLVAFEASPFPYNGMVPRSKKPFLNFQEDGREGRKTPSGRIYWADKTYSDRRVLLHIPKGFDASRPGVMMVFFHGHGATLERDVATRQRVPAQITQSGMNAVLVAPQFAVNARDSSAGNFWKPGAMRRFLDEVAVKLAKVHGDPASKATFANMPVVIVGYSGGYLPLESALANGQISKRVKGVVLLDGLYGGVSTFSDWIARNRSAFFLSAYTGSTRKGNNALKERLGKRDIAYRTVLQSRLLPGSVTIIAIDEEHRNYVTRAWTDNPLSDLLVRMTGVAHRTSGSLSASLSPALTQ